MTKPVYFPEHLLLFFLSNDVTCTKVTTAAANRGFSEYSIQQHATKYSMNISCKMH